MSNSIPVGKKIIVSVVLAVVGYLVIYFVGLGISDNGALGMALGLLVGAFFAPQLLSISLGALPKKVKISPAKPSISTTSDSEIVSIFVGNLAFRVRGRQLAELFEPFGPIESIRIVKDRNTGRGKGFGFVDMKASAARRAIAELDGSEFFGRTIKVSEANAQKDDE